jgi:exo-beta-1,3-glucanase (GH17 family)
MTIRRPTRDSILLIICLLLAAGSFCIWAFKGRAHRYPDAPQGEFACLSYTPRSASAQGNGAATQAQIERDLKQLSTRTHCVRTYSVTNGLEQVPVIARSLGMRVLLGIWIGSNEATNELELARGIEVANANRDVIDAVIVGNEVLLRREQTAAALTAMLLRVRDATQLPVTYADVWDFWLKNPQMAPATSFITIHILPYWEDEPVGIDAAMAHVKNIYQKAQQTFPGRRIYVGETGWPSAGRQREAALPSLLNQARFTRDFIAYASTHELPYNFIEAYDQPWKRRLEGTVGGYWGLYDAQGREKFPLLGSVITDPQWWRGPLSGGVIAILFTLLAWRIHGSQSVTRLVSYLLLGFSFGAVLMLQWDYLWLANRNWQEWLASSAWALCCDLVFVLVALRLAGASPLPFLEKSAENEGEVGSGLAKHLALTLTLSPRERGLEQRLQFALLLGLAYINLGLVFDARYRDFPSVFLLLPVIAFTLRRFVYGQTAHRLSAEQMLFSSWTLLSAIAIAVIEGRQNLSALLWSGLCVLFAVANLPAIVKAQVQQRT